MNGTDLDKYLEKALAKGATGAKVIDPASVVTAAWVRMKCYFGCPYKNSHSCPPQTPSPKETRNVLDCYKRAILFHREAPKNPERGKEGKEYLDMLVKLEGEIYKDGYYKTFVYLAGPCRLCKECAKVKDNACIQPGKMRPSMESCGIDVFQTARNNGFFIKTLREKTDTQNIYCLVLLD